MSTWWATWLILSFFLIELPYSTSDFALNEKNCWRKLAIIGHSKCVSTQLPPQGMRSTYISSRCRLYVYPHASSFRMIHIANNYTTNERDAHEINAKFFPLNKWKHIANPTSDPTQGTREAVIVHFQSKVCRITIIARPTHGAGTPITFLLRHIPKHSCVLKIFSDLLLVANNCGITRDADSTIDVMPCS